MRDRLKHVEERRLVWGPPQLPVFVLFLFTISRLNMKLALCFEENDSIAVE